jgi:adenine C2-methylase RlmN of 23S rRNA A2503 and tRNA A37
MARRRHVHNQGRRNVVLTAGEIVGQVRVLANALEDPRRLAKLLSGVKSKVNLIPLSAARAFRSSGHRTKPSIGLRRFWRTIT